METETDNLQSNSPDPEDDLVITGDARDLPTPRRTFFSMAKPIGGEASAASHRDAFLKPVAPMPVAPEERNIPEDVERAVMKPEAGVLLITAYSPERNVFRTYFREHQITCRAAINPEHGMQLVLEMRPAVVVLSGSQLSPDEILTVLDDLSDLTTVPILLLLSEIQTAHLQGCLLYTSPSPRDS